MNKYLYSHQGMIDTESTSPISIDLPNPPLSSKS